MPESIGGAVFEIWTDNVKLERGIQSAREKAKQLSGDFGRLGKKIENSLKGAHFERLGKQLTSVGKKLTLGLTAPLAAFGALAAKTAGDFQQGMNRVAAVSGATGDQLGQLREQAKELGRTTQFSASQAAEGMGFLAQAGFEANEILGAMPGTLQLAAASQIELGEAADIASNILSGYGLEVEELTRVNDVLVATTSSTNTNLTQLGEAMKFAAPVASAAGIRFEQASAALGLMGQAGIQASMAGTSLRGAITRILNPTKEAEESMRQAGLSFTDAAGRLLPLDQIIQQLEPHAEDVGLMMELFGDRAGSALQALVSEGSDALRELTKNLEESGGTAERIAKVQMEGFNGAMRAMKSAFEGLQIAIAESGLLDFLTSAVKKVTAWMQRLSELNPTILKWGVLIGAAAGAIGPLVLVVGHLTTALVVNTAAILGNQAAMGTGFLKVLRVVGSALSGLAIKVVAFTAVLASTSVALLTGGTSMVTMSGIAAGLKIAFAGVIAVLMRPVGLAVVFFSAGAAIGYLLNKFTAIGDVVDKFLDKLPFIPEKVDQNITKSVEKVSSEIFEMALRLEEAGVKIERTGLSWKEWEERVKAAAEMQESMSVASAVAAAELEKLKNKLSTVDKTAHDANTTLNTLTESQRKLADRLKDLQALPQEVAEQIAFLERAGFSAEQQFALLSGRLDELVRASELVKLQIPDSAQELIEFGEAAQAAQEQFHKSMDKIGESIKGQAGEMGKLIKNTDSWGKSVIGLEKKLKEKLKTLAKLEKEAAKVFNETGQNIQGFQQWGKGTSELRERIERLSETLESGRERMTALKERADALKRSIEADERAFRDLQERIRKVTGKELKGFQKAADKVKDSIDRKKGALVSAQGEYDNLADVVAASEGQLEHLNETLDEHKNNLGDVGEAAKGMARKQKEAIDEAAREAERLNRVWEETMGNVVASISENLTDALFEAKSFADGMKKTFKEMAKGLVQILIAELFSPLRNMMLNLGNMLGSLFSGKGTGGLNFGNLFGGGGLSLAAGAAGAGGAGGAAGAGGAGGFGAIGGAISGGAKAIWGFMASNPITVAIAGAAALGLGLYRLFTQGPIEAGSKETVRDFGVGVSESSIKGFLPSVGLSKKQFKPIRKDILSSPKFLEDMLIPAARAQGKLEELIASFSRLETEWGTFDLSGPLREAIESGNFQAYNDAWEEVFQSSKRLVSQFGPDFIEVLGGTETGLGDAGEAASKYSEEIKNLAAASGVGVENLDVFSAAMDSQKGIVGGLQEGMAGFLGTVVGFGETLRAETDLTDDQIQRLGWEMFGDQARELAAGFEALGLELPPLMQMILDFGDAFNAFSDEVMMAAEAIGVASENMDTFGTAYLSGASTLGALQERTAALSGEISGLTSLLLQSMDAAQANEVIWALFGDNITQVAQEFITLGQEVPSFIQDMLDVGASINAVSDEFIRMADAADIAKDQWDAFARGREKGAQTAKGVSDRAAFLVGDIEAWTDKNLSRFGDDVEAAQKLGWDVFGRQAQAIVTQLDAYRLDVPGLLRLVVDWGRDRGLMEGQNIPRPNLPTPPRTSLSRSFGGSSRSVSSGSSSLASLSASGLLPIQKAAEQLAQGQAEQVVPLLRSINQGINPDEGVETRFLPRRTVVRREEVAEIVKDILILDEGGVREVIREIR